MAIFWHPNCRRRDMPDKSSGPSTYVNRQRAAEQQDRSAHTHLAAEHHGKGEHLTGAEHSRQAMEHTGEQAATQHGVHTFGHQEIAELAYELWQSRGCPDGSSDTDWFQAVHTLRARAHGK
jgi:hypothetical protein